GCGFATRRTNPSGTLQNGAPMSVLRASKGARYTGKIDGAGAAARLLRLRNSAPTSRDGTQRRISRKGSWSSTGSRLRSGALDSPARARFKPAAGSDAPSTSPIWCVLVVRISWQRVHFRMVHLLLGFVRRRADSTIRASSEEAGEQA